ncbi:hypothetical protein J437_LFUL005093 [Ladona fulva]|uniref:Small-subunit processome Utp12 domain-containing protein n=1 Tax=Ladona fulva TaxID=123851 RepID=A0A8K0NWI8_LADFU|nr:hypothetical protein J437_LFUL005093 [Ladona fulva]
MAREGCSSFSGNGSYFAYCSPDGKLKIWDTATNVLKQEYTPNLHLSEPFSCICWLSLPAVGSKGKSHSPSARKKLRKSDPGESELLALGTKKGNIILYCIASGSAIGQLKDGHTKAINGLCYSSKRNSLFSCSSDKNVVEWKVNDRTIKSKWKAGKSALTSILDLQDGESLLVASSSISWWDVDNKEVLKTFTGHATSVDHMVYIPSDMDGKPYFISASSQDRVVNAWILDAESPELNACITFSLADTPEKMTVGIPTADNPNTTLSVVTASGVLQIFQHKLNGVRPKPLKPTLTVDIDCNGKPVNIFGVHDNEGTVLIAHGFSFGQLTFEKIPVKADSSHLHLVRHPKKAIRKEESETKVKVPEEGDALYLSTTQSGSASVSKRKKHGEDKISEAQLPMEERLNNLALSSTKKQPAGAKTPSIEHSAHLLLQGLHSKDRDILHNVFLNKDEKMIRNTVMRLPVTAIIPLVRELSQLIQKKGILAEAGVHWLHVVLLIHGAHLLASGMEELTPLLGIVESRTLLLPRLLRLRGRLGLLLEREGLRGQGASLAEPIQEAALVHCDESSDEDSMVNDIRAYSSESEDNWEEASEEEDDDDDGESLGKEDSEIDEKDIEEEGDG